MKSIGILSYLVETDIGGKGKGLLLVETCYAQNKVKLLLLSATSLFVLIVFLQWGCLLIHIIRVYVT
jgi:hypothetical protein